MDRAILLERSEEGGFTATVPSLPGCISEGNDAGEAVRNIEEAIALHLDDSVGVEQSGSSPGS